MGLLFLTDTGCLMSVMAVEGELVVCGGGCGIVVAMVVARFAPGADLPVGVGLHHMTQQTMELKEVSGRGGELVVVVMVILAVMKPLPRIRRSLPTIPVARLHHVSLGLVFACNRVSKSFLFL